MQKRIAWCKVKKQGTRYKEQDPKSNVQNPKLKFTLRFRHSALDIGHWILGLVPCILYLVSYKTISVSLSQFDFTVNFCRIGITFSGCRCLSKNSPGSHT